MIITEEMRKEVCAMDARTDFRNRWVVFHPVDALEGDLPYSFELSPEYTIANDYYKEMKRPDQAGDAVMMPIHDCYPEKL